MKTKLHLLTFSLCVLLLSCNSNAKPVQPQTTASPTEDNHSIQVALLLDTSNSMDGLIEQAKSRLWNIVNTLTTLKYDGKTPNIEIALYEYGNDNLSVEGNYIRQVTPLTTDLDLISEKLFTLKTNGGNEYCGAVIADATQKLTWGDGKDGMKLIYIAGNEGFDQGGISYKEAIGTARKKDIYVNTIFCGNQTQGINLQWKTGADTGDGKYFNIDSDRAVVYIATPYDDALSACNEKMNKTYIGYGSQGDRKKIVQVQQDANAYHISKANSAERTVSKSKEVYKNDDWDLVDKVKKEKNDYTKIKKEELPAELKGKTDAEIKTIVEAKTKERETVQKEIGELAKKRQEFIDADAKKQGKSDDFGAAVSQSIVTVAKNKGFSVAVE